MLLVRVDDTVVIFAADRCTTDDFPLSSLFIVVNPLSLIIAHASFDSYPLIAAFRLIKRHIHATVDDSRFCLKESPIKKLN